MPEPLDPTDWRAFCACHGWPADTPVPSDDTRDLLVLLDREAPYALSPAGRTLAAMLEDKGYG
jgi:hypothetical protein